MKSRDVETDSHIEGNLAAEVSMVALDTLELVIQVRFKVSVYLCFCTIMNSFWKKKRVSRMPRKNTFGNIVSSIFSLFCNILLPLKF